MVKLIIFSLFFRFQFATGNDKQNEGYNDVVAEKLIAATSEFGQRINEMTVNDMKEFILRISEEAAQELLLSLPNKHINKECVMNTCNYKIGLFVSYPPPTPQKLL